MAPFQTRRDPLVSFDGGIGEEVEVARPDKLRFWTGGDWPAAPAAVSRGAGLSYAAASFGAGSVSIEHRAFDRLIAFDPASGTLTVEAGADLWTCQRFLLARGFHLSCHPGHGRITIGGCVAAEVHGKNPWRDGTFSAQVRGLTLMHPDHGVLTLTPERDPELLALTCGGFGLTGHILTVTLAAKPVRAPRLVLTRHALPDFAGAFEALQQAVRTADYAYSWHDLSSRRGAHFVFSAAADLAAQGGDPAVADEPPALSSGTRGRLPFNLYNRWSLPVVNAAYRLKTRRFRDGRRIGILDALFPIHGSEAYFRLYGRPGFHEYQALVPSSSAAWFAEAVRTRAARRGVTVALCSAKAFGGSARFLRFAGEGIALAFNVPRGQAATALMTDIDALLVDIGGKPNIIKDARLPAAVARACYPELDAFRADLGRFDPHRRVQSALSERLAL